MHTFRLSSLSGTSDFSQPDRVTVSGIMIRGPGIRDSFLTAMRTGADRALAADGAGAFGMPRIAAAAHEAGHCIVGTSLDFAITNVRLIELFPGADLWGGITHHAQDNKADTPLMDAADALRHARMIYAGVGGEMFLHQEFQHAGSSLDEIVMSQYVTAVFVADEHEDPEPRWQRDVHNDVVARIYRNRVVFQKIAELLYQKGRLAGPRLRKLLNGVAR